MGSTLVMNIVLWLVAALLSVRCSEITQIKVLFEVDPDAALAHIKSHYNICKLKEFGALVPLVIKHGDVEILEHVSEKAWKYLFKTQSIDKLLWGCPEDLRNEASAKAACVVKGMCAPSSLVDVLKLIIIRRSQTKPEVPLLQFVLSLTNIGLHVLEHLNLYGCCVSLHSAYKDLVQTRYLSRDITAKSQWRLSFLKLYLLFKERNFNDMILHVKLAEHPVFQHYSHILQSSNVTAKVKYLPSAVVPKLSRSFPKTSIEKNSKVPVLKLLQRNLHPDLAYAMVDRRPDVFLRKWKENTEESPFRDLWYVPRNVLSHPVIHLISLKVPIGIISIRDTSALIKSGLPRSVNEVLSLRLTEINPSHWQIKRVLSCVWSAEAFTRLFLSLPPSLKISSWAFSHATTIGLSNDIIYLLFTRYKSSDMLSPVVLEWLLQNLEGKMLLEVLETIRFRVCLNDDTVSRCIAIAQKHNHGEEVISWLKRYAKVSYYSEAGAVLRAITRQIR